MLTNLKTKLNNLWDHPGFRRYFANTGWLFAGRIFQMGIAFFVGVWVARYLGPSEFGLLSFARSFVGLFMAISTLGLDGIVIRELVKDESRRDFLLGTSFVLKLIGAIVALALVSIAIYFTSTDNLTRLMVILIAASLIFQSFNVVDLYFQSKVVSKFSVFAQVFSTTLSGLLKVYLIITKASVIYFAAMAIFDMATIGAGYIYFYKKCTNETLTKWKFDLQCAKSLLKDSWPLIFSGIAVGIYMKIDQVMIKYMLNNKAVGEYAVAVRLCEIWYIIPVIITSSLFPAIMNAKKQGEKLYYDRLQKLYSLMIWLAIMIAFSLSIFSKKLIEFLYGVAYMDSYTVLYIYIWVSIFVFVGVAFSKYLIIENYTQKNLYRTILGAGANIICNIILIPRYNIIGAAISTLIGQIIANYIYDLFDKDLRRVFYLKIICLNPIKIF